MEKTSKDKKENICFSYVCACVCAGSLHKCIFFYGLHFLKYRHRLDRDINIYSYVKDIAGKVTQNTTINPMEGHHIPHNIHEYLQKYNYNKK